MENVVVEAPASRPAAPIASSMHLGLVVALLGLWSYRGATATDRVAQMVTGGRAGFYLRTAGFEWAMLGVVLLGVRLHGSSVYAVIGERWRSAREIARDIGIAAAFWVISTMLLSMPSLHDHSGPTSPTVQAMLPTGWLESTLWVGLSITAGICEEAIYRGYIQRQLIAFTTSVPAGIALSAIAFGLAHSYQGPIGAARIAIGALMLGVLAYWRKSVRPGMMAHAFGDAFAGVLARLLKIRVA
jgi:membrane protease YdiL (CAAX protease family)